MNNLVSLNKPLSKLGAFKGVKDEINNNNYPIGVTGCLESEICHFISAVSNGVKWRVIITTDSLKAQAMYSDFKLFEENLYLYPERDVIFYSADVHGNAVTMQRLRCVEAILDSKEGGTIITTLQAGLEALHSIERYKKSKVIVKKDEDYDMDDLSVRMVELGYVRRNQVEGPGEFSVRGEIFDVFPPSSECPYRIDFFDTTIDTIKSFDVESQRSIEEHESIEIFAASEIILSDEEVESGFEKIEKDVKSKQNSFKKKKEIKSFNEISRTFAEIKNNLKYTSSKSGLETLINYFDDETVSFFDYFDDKTMFFIDDYERCVENSNIVIEEFTDSMVTRIDMGKAFKKQLKLLFDVNKIFNKIKKRKTIFFSLLDDFKKLGIEQSFHVNVQSVISYNKHFNYLIEDLKSWKKQGYKVIILSASHTRGKRLVDDLGEYDIEAFYHDELDVALKDKQIMVSYGGLKKGFVYPTLKFVVVSENDIFGAKIKRKKAKKKAVNANSLQSFNELSVGDYVIHENHGIAVYKGIEKIKVDKITKDFIKLEYADGGNLFVPASNLDMLQKYANKDAEKSPKLDNLNAIDWNRRKARVKKGVRDIAKELVKLYAERNNKKGYRFGADTVWQREFEELFPFEETDDQLDAIAAAKRDMESDRIMDRLICGDVGYGKTEVALRAVFKCVNDGKQAAVLVPTTILARQHYNTFKERIGDYPIKVAMVSRLRSSADNKKTIEKLKKGEIDIIIGTHRLLSKDVAFKNLGLLVVDEEQRFGVTHKEKIKNLKKNVDVLTLSATPIPRTLHMSLVGIRDMSVLEEPPIDRMPIQTYVMEYSDEIVREAINREVSRGGQVYFIHNIVEDISDVAYRISEMMPDVNVAYAHGRMSAKELETIMMNFIAGEIDVLVSTTIVETGIDIPNVNTIIIDNSDRMGLSQLYQLRGRVGRSNRLAYAFMMYRKDKILSEVAEKRLSAIKEFTALGSGIRVAMRDLEIRGAGNILGAEQSGHMGDVGYDLYCKMLAAAIRKYQLNEKDSEEDLYDFETTIDIKVDAYIPVKYIKSEFVKLDMYKRISLISNEEDYTDMQEELRDRFGPIPPQLQTLLKVALLKSKAHELFVDGISQNGDEIRFSLRNNNKISSIKLLEMIKSYKRTLRFVSGERPMLIYCPRKKPIERREFVMDKSENDTFNLLFKILEDLSKTIENNEVTDK